MEKFSAEQFIDFLGRIEKLKSVPRHCVTADGVVENVAAHSWRTAVMAYLMKDELEDIDTDKVIRMCLLHEDVYKRQGTFRRSAAETVYRKSSCRTAGGAFNG